jgi:hypothetical protein
MEATLHEMEDFSHNKFVVLRPKNQTLKTALKGQTRLGDQSLDCKEVTLHAVEDLWVNEQIKSAKKSPVDYNWKEYLNWESQFTASSVPKNPEKALQKQVDDSQQINGEITEQNYDAVQGLKGPILIIGKSHFLGHAPCNRGDQNQSVHATLHLKVAENYNTSLKAHKQSLSVKHTIELSMLGVHLGFFF